MVPGVPLVAVAPVPGRPPGLRSLRVGPPASAVSARAAVTGVRGGGRLGRGRRGRGGLLQKEIAILKLIFFSWEMTCFRHEYLEGAAPGRHPVPGGGGLEEVDHLAVHHNLPHAS